MFPLTAVLSGMCGILWIPWVLAPYVGPIEHCNIMAKIWAWSLTSLQNIWLEQWVCVCVCVCMWCVHACAYAHTHMRAFIILTTPRTSQVESTYTCSAFTIIWCSRCLSYLHWPKRTLGDRGVKVTFPQVERARIWKRFESNLRNGLGSQVL